MVMAPECKLQAGGRYLRAPPETPRALAHTSPEAQWRMMFRLWMNTRTPRSLLSPWSSGIYFCWVRDPGCIYFSWEIVGSSWTCPPTLLCCHHLVIGIPVSTHCPGSICEFSVWTQIEDFSCPVICLMCSEYLQFVGGKDAAWSIFNAQVTVTPCVLLLECSIPVPRSTPFPSYSPILDLPLPLVAKLQYWQCTGNVILNGNRWHAFP